ncbi:MAG: Transcription regulator, SpoVT/AbrB family [Candidatus Collierbacteria bacterium GW2011_GWB1_44_6]|uniref:Transcription regulator, SpoVT/AbrB family n=1 Tax=Candidatus Collierbacteria bacterium GW2011_GWB1_44_6 TaxID=1618384 RepID=A0A0G1LS31_9BACT|nr:MAG: Transcription regulator, SpoVT/AbrB family [Candidatus Collierbacteria bacterium GW2011_GWB1_44_6]
MGELIEIGKISSRGQIAIPSDIRKELDLKEGQRVLFFLGDDTLIIKKINSQTFEELTKPLRDAKKKIKESEVNALIHRLRKR